MLAKKNIGKIPEYDKRQNLFDKMASMRDYSMENPELRDVAEKNYKKPFLKDIKALSKKNAEKKKELESLKKDNSELLFPQDYSKMQITKGQNLETDLKDSITDFNILKRRATLFDDYRKNLKTVLKRFFNFGGLSNRTVILPMKNMFSEQDIIKINKGADKIGNIKEVMHLNREVITKTNDQEIIKYLKDNGYTFQDVDKDFYESKAYNKNHVKVDLVAEFRKIRDSIKSLESKKNILTKMDPKLEQYQAIAGDIKKISEFRHSFLSRMEIIQNQSDDLDNMDDIGVIVLSWIPRHIMSQSTGTIWRSCMSFQQEQEGEIGINIKFVGSGIQDGVFIGWLVKIKDLKTIKEPKARILIKPFVNTFGDVVWWPSKIYHDGSLIGGDAIMFKRVLKNYCYTRQKRYGLGTISIRDTEKVYDDDIDQMDEDEFDNFEEEGFADEGLEEKNVNTKTFEQQIEETQTNFYKIFYSIGFTNKKMFDYLEKQSLNYFDEDVIVNLFKMSYLSNNLFFLQYALDKGLEAKMSIYTVYVERINDIIVNNTFNEKALNIFFSFIKKNKNVQVGIHGDLDLFVFSVLYSKQLQKNSFSKIDNKLFDFMIKNEDVMSNIFTESPKFSASQFVKLTIKEYDAFSKEQRKEINKYLKKYLIETKESKIDTITYANIQVLIDTFRHENKVFFDDMQKVLDSKNVNFERDYLHFFANGDYNDLFFSHEVLKNVISIYKKNKNKMNDIQINSKILKNNITSAYIKTLENKRQLDKKLVDEAKEIDLINGKNLDNKFNYQIVFDKDLLIQYLTKDNIHSDKVIQFMDSFRGYTEKIDTTDLILYINEKIPDIKLFANPKIFNVFKIFEYDQVGEFGQITNIRSAKLFVIDEQITKELLKYQSENFVMHQYLKTMFFYKETFEKNMEIFSKLFKDKKIVPDKVIVDSHLINLIITGYHLKEKTLEKIINYFDKELMFKEVNNVDIDSAISNGLLTNKPLIKYFIENDLVDRFKVSQKMKALFFQALVLDMDSAIIRAKNSKYNSIMNTHFNRLREDKELFLQFVGEVIKDEKYFDFALPKKMSDKINGVRTVSPFESRGMNRAQIENIERQRGLQTQPKETDILDLMKLNAIFFILTKYFKIDKTIINDSKAMEYYNILVEKNDKRIKNDKDPLSENINDLLKNIKKYV